MPHTPNAIRAALFVDFDNVYLSLRNFDRRAADVFAERPSLWLNWLESGAHAALDENAKPIPRRVLIRNCYLNPAAFSRQRSFFTRAAFTVVDCPSLTARGKNSADILMAMDILDGIEHPTRFDEFIILTSDADFTPVLLRLRAHDRITSVLTSTITAAAFRQACDVSIDLETFAVEALGLPKEELRAPRGPGVASEGQPPPGQYADVRPKAAHALVEAARKSGAIPTQDAHKILSRVGEFQNSFWFGMGTLKALLDDLVRLEPDLFVEMDGSLPASIRLRRDGDPEPIVQAPPPAEDPAVSPPAVAVSEPDEPSSSPTPEFTPAVARFMEDINVLVGVPKLTAADYSSVFKALSGALAGGAIDRDQLLQETGANLPDGAQVRRGDASYILANLAENGCMAKGGGLGAAALDAAELARCFRDSVVSALANSQRALDDGEREMLDHWLMGAEACAAAAAKDDDEAGEPNELFEQGADEDEDEAEGDVEAEAEAEADVEAADEDDFDLEDGAADMDEDEAARAEDEPLDEAETGAEADADIIEDAVEDAVDDEDRDDDDASAHVAFDEESESGHPSDGLRLPWDRRWRKR